jgi:hypothetical protein
LDKIKYNQRSLTEPLPLTSSLAKMRADITQHQLLFLLLRFSRQGDGTLLNKKFYLELEIKISNSSGRRNAIIRISPSPER